MRQGASTFQEIIQRLNDFWARRGCLLWYPYSEKVGAGTMNPATVLRVLGPERWNVAYVEPSYRPDDGRFGENPNRMQMHTQYQVILQPDPGDPQGDYLQSLEAIGIDTTKHDIRFVEDNWESPALGAWGLGWEVWLDGLEITQFTYFQQSASQPLEIPAVEITYGLERIAMFLQGVRQVWDITWDSSLSYGDVLLQTEIDHCRYDFEVADIGRLSEIYRLSEAEARTAVEAGLSIPAMDYLLRCSHFFNLLDARGAIGVNERVSYFSRMRDLARLIGESYLASRERLAFPWKCPAPSSPPAPDCQPPLDEAADFVLELGTEELPPQDIQSAIRQWEQAVPALLQDLRLSHRGIQIHGTPRRLVALVEELAPRQAEQVVTAKGPAADKAFDSEGNPTPAAVGFARAHNVHVDSLTIESHKGRDVVVAKKSDAGRDAASVLLEAIPKLVANLRFEKSMRWDATGTSFSRPVRWLLALHGDRAVAFRHGNLLAGRATRAPRHMRLGELQIESARSYPQLLAEHQVMLDRDRRRRAILESAQALAGEVGGVVPEDDRLLDEVTDLVEWPAAIRGRFAEEYLELPKELLITVMKKHQRYLPVIRPDGSTLLPYFITVVNGDGRDLDLVRRGNEDVIRARYADAAYFVRQDAKQRLDEFVPALSRIVFHEQLGSMLEKQRRVEKLVPLMARVLGLSGEECRSAERAARLCKADLATSMVVEITALQGFMGREYARRSGETEPVCEAILEHYLPRFAGDALPTTGAGVALGLADRFDSLAGLFAAGLRPSSSADPFGIRRIAIGLIQILIDRQVSLSLYEQLAAAGGVQSLREVHEEDMIEARDFLVERLEVRLRDQGRPADVVSAVLAAQGDNPFRAALASAQLHEAVCGADWPDILHSYARCKRMVRDLPESYPLVPRCYTEPSARALVAQWEKAAAQMESGSDVATLVSVLRGLQTPINNFFDEVLVMTEDTKLREARLGLIQRIANLAEGVADLSRLHGF